MRLLDQLPEFTWCAATLLVGGRVVVLDAAWREPSEYFDALERLGASGVVKFWHNGCWQTRQLGKAAA